MFVASIAVAGLSLSQRMNDSSSCFHGFVFGSEDELGLELWQKQARFKLAASIQQNDSAVVPRRQMRLQIGASSNSWSTTSFNEHQLLGVSLVGGIAFVTFSIYLWAWSSLSWDPDKNSRSALHSLLSPHSHRPQAVLFRSFIAILILMNIGALLIQSTPRLGARYGMELDLLEAVSAWIFLVEYCMRLYVIPESRRYKAKTAWSARLSWMVTFESLVDLLSFAPWFIEQGAAILSPTTTVQLPVFTWLRILRLFRLFKVSFVSESLDVFARVLYYNREILIVSLILCAVLTVLLSILLFFVAPKGEQDEDFSSIPACIYLAVMMLTGQGNPEGDLPWYTKLVVLITCVFAVGLFAIQASMLTWGFENEADRRVKKQKQQKIDKVEAILGGDQEDKDSSSSSDEELDKAWIEYEENIASDEEADSEAGEVVEADDQEPSAWTESEEAKLFPDHQLEQLKTIFKMLDITKDGQLSVNEVARLPNLDVGKLFKKYDKDVDHYIRVTEFLSWVSAVKEKQSPEIVQMLLDHLLHRCKENKKEQRKVSDAYEIQVDHMEKILEDFKEFKRIFNENKQLEAENEQLKKQLKQQGT